MKKTSNSKMGWNNYLLIPLVIILALIQPLQSHPLSERSQLPELCPCLPINLCPRVYGASADDIKYLGEFMKCAKDLEVRCCGASVSTLVNAPSEMEPKPQLPSEIDRLKYLADNEIEDVRIEHLTIPPEEPEVITTTTEQPMDESTTELIETTTFTTEDPSTETTTMFDEDSFTTTTVPEEDVTLPRFGKNVQFIYAVTPEPEEIKGSKRHGKKLSFGSSSEEDDDNVAKENVFIIMPTQFLEDEAAAAQSVNSIEQSSSSLSSTESTLTSSEVIPTTTTESPPTYPPAVTPASTSSSEVTNGPEHTTVAFDDDEDDDNNQLIATTTEIPEPTTTTRRPRIRKKIRVKVRKGFRNIPRLNPNDLLAQVDPEITTVENTRKNRDLDAPKRKINHSIYARKSKQNVLEMKNTISTEASPPVETTTISSPMTTTTPQPPTSSAHQNPAILTLLTSNASKRKNFLNRKIVKPEIKEVVNEKVPTPARNDKLEEKHQEMIQQVVKAVQQNSQMSTFDLADELMDPEMAMRIAYIQRMLAEEIMEEVLKKIGVKKEKEDHMKITTTTTTTTEQPKEAESSQTANLKLKHHFRGSKRYIDTNFLNAYENVIHKVEEKIKSHKTHKGRPTRPVTEATTKASKTEEPHVQILLNQRRRSQQKQLRITTTSTTTTPQPEVVTEESPALETITEIIEQLEKKIQATEFKPSQLWEVISTSEDDDVLSAPIDLLGRNARASSGFIPSQTRTSALVSLTLPAEQQNFRFA